jgi:hypothetical protein
MFEVVDDHVHEDLRFFVLATQVSDFSLHRFVVHANYLAEVIQVSLDIL